MFRSPSSWAHTLSIRKFRSGLEYCMTESLTKVVTGVIKSLGGMITTESQYLTERYKLEFALEPDWLSAVVLSFYFQFFSRPLVIKLPCYCSYLPIYNEVIVTESVLCPLIGFIGSIWCSMSDLSGEFQVHTPRPCIFHWLILIKKTYLSLQVQTCLFTLVLPVICDDFFLSSTVCKACLIRCWFSTLQQVRVESE